MSSTSMQGAGRSTPAWRVARYRKILSAAIETLKSEPEAGVSMDRIARAAGVGKSTLYRYFDTKDALVRVCLQEIIDDLGSRMEAVEESGEPIPERLTSIVTCMVESFSNHLLPLRMVTRDRRELDDTWRWWVRDARRRLVTVLRRHFERGERAGVYGPIDLDLVPQMVMGMIRSGVTHTTGFSSQELGRRIAAFVLRASSTDVEAVIPSDSRFSE